MYIKYIYIYVHMNVTYDDLFFNKDLGNYNQATADNLPIGAYILKYFILGMVTNPPS